MSDSAYFDTSPTKDALSLERDREDREAAAERYMAKFRPLFDAIEREIAGLRVLGLYDTAAVEAANILADALADARATVNANAE